MVLLLTQGRQRLHYSMSVMAIHDWIGLFTVWFGTQNYNSLRLSFSIQGITNSIYLAEVLQGYQSEIRSHVWKHCASQKAACRASLDKYLPSYFYQILHYGNGLKERLSRSSLLEMLMGENVELECVKSHTQKTCQVGCSNVLFDRSWDMMCSIKRDFSFGILAALAWTHTGIVKGSHNQ